MDLVMDKQTVTNKWANSMALVWVKSNVTNPLDNSMDLVMD